MDDHIGLITKNISEPIVPDEKLCSDIEEEEIEDDDGYEINVDDMDTFVVNPNHMEILGNVLKSYDKITAGTVNSDWIQFTLNDSGNTFLITVRRNQPKTSCDSSVEEIPELIYKNNVVSEANSESDVDQKTVKVTDCKIINNDKQVIPETVYSETMENVQNSESDTGVMHTAEEMKNKFIELSDNESLIESQHLINQNSMHLEDPNNQFIDDSVSNEIILHEIFDSSPIVIGSTMGKSKNKILNDPGNKSAAKSSSTKRNSKEKGSLMKNISKLLGKKVKMIRCEYCSYKTEVKYRMMSHMDTLHPDKCKDTEDGNDDTVATDNESNVCESSTTSSKLKKPKRMQKREQALNEFIDFICKGPSKKVQISKVVSSNGNTPDTQVIQKCCFCKYTCSNMTELYRHIGVIHAHDPSNRYSAGKLTTDCVFCPFKGAHRRSLLLHLRTKHEGGKIYQCEKCTYKTQHKTNFDRHVEVVHEKKRDYKCSECGLMTTRNYLLQKHIMFKHKGIMPYRCPEEGCDFGSTSCSARKAHVLEYHLGMKPHRCPVALCKFDTSQPYLLKKHMLKEHKIETPLTSQAGRDKSNNEPVSHTCPYCDNVFTQRGNLQKHIRIKHNTGDGKRYKCAECDFSSSEKCFVKTHINEVHLNQFPYSCDLCNFKCSVRQRFERHFSAVHMGHRPYQCELCNYRASQAIHLRRHIEVIHKGEKPHFCVYCKFNTAHRGNLKAHLKAIHKVSAEDVKEVLKSCLDIRGPQKRGKKRSIIEEDRSKRGRNQGELVLVESGGEVLKEEIVYVAEDGEDGIPCDDPQHDQPSQSMCEPISDLEALEASLVLEKIGQNQSFTIEATDAYIDDHHELDAEDVQYMTIVPSPVKGKKRLKVNQLLPS